MQTLALGPPRPRLSEPVRRRPGQAANLISNITHNLTEAATTIALVVARALQLGAAEVEGQRRSEQAWVELLEEADQTLLADPDCTPGYYNNEGRPLGRRERLNGARYPLRPRRLLRVHRQLAPLRRVRGLEFRVTVPDG